MKVFRIIFIIIAALSINGCADVESTVNDSSNVMSNLYVTFADGTGGFSPTMSEPYNNEVTINIPWYYPDGTYNQTSLDSLIITSTIPNNSLLKPSMGLTNFSSPIEYSLTNLKGDVQKYKVSVVRKKSSKAEILSFLLNETNISCIVTDSLVVIPFTKLDVSSQTATYKISNYAKISPDPSLAHNYTVPLKYTVTADDGTIAYYTAKIGRAIKLEKGFSSMKMLWSKSAGDLVFSDYAQISLAVCGDYIVTPLSNCWDSGSSAKYYNRSNGAYVGDLNVTGVSGLYALANDESGKMVGINNLYAGQYVRIYKWNSVTSTPELLINTNSWDCVGGSSFYGRNLSVYGNLDKDAVIMTTTDGTGGTNSILKWVIKDGKVVSQTPELIKYGKSWGYVAKAIPVGTTSGSNYFLCSNYPSYIDYVNGPDNSIISSFSPNFLPSLRGLTPNLTYFEFNNSKYAAIIDASAYSGAMQLFDVTQTSLISTSCTSADYSKFHVFDGESNYLVCPNANWNVTGDVAIAPTSTDGFTKDVYFLLTNGGIVAYEMNCIDTSKF
jgi:hypothetical protein